jgi:hypothetical protein
MTVTFRLTTPLTAAGPYFNISGTTSGGALNDVSIQTEVTKTQLLLDGGYSIENISDSITGGTIASTGTCTTTDTWLTNPTALGVLLDNDFILGMTAASTCPAIGVYNQVYISQDHYDTHYLTGGSKFIKLYQDEDLLIPYTGYTFVYINGPSGGTAEIFTLNSSTGVILNPANHICTP